MMKGFIWTYLFVSSNLASSSFVSPRHIQIRQSASNLQTKLISQISHRSKDVSIKLSFDTVGIEQIILIGSIGSSVAYAYLNRENKIEKTETITENLGKEEPIEEAEEKELIVQSVEEDETLSSIRSPDVSVAKRAVASTKKLVTERIKRMESFNVVTCGEPEKENESPQKEVENIIVLKAEKSNRKRRLVARLVRKILLPWTKF